MIKELQLQNFKCFQDSKPFEFSKLNLLTGVNGRGKSSLLQAMLVLSQSVWKYPHLEKLVINGELLNLGNFDDIKNSITPRGENIYFNFKFNLPSINIEDAKIEFIENPDEALIAECIKIDITSNKSLITIKPSMNEINVKILELVEFFKAFHFISADRLGPVKYVDKTNLPSFMHVGSRGEHTINILANAIKNFENVNDLLYRGNDSNSVIQQTMEWLSYILDGAKIDIKGLDRDSSVLYMLLNNRNDSYRYKPANVGFGYSYILPLVVTGLIAKPGEIIIVENPEAHLHPRAQSRIAEFFAKVATCGIQVFIESHSEHILNGLRVSALNPDISINYDELAIHYFNESFDSEKLTMDKKGKIANWPNGFFDQQEIDLATIFKLTR